MSSWTGFRSPPAERWPWGWGTPTPSNSPATRPNYRACTSTGKYGGDIVVAYNVTIIGGGGTTQTLNTLIYDFSGSSYHYNSDFATSARVAALIHPTLGTL